MHSTIDVNTIARIWQEEGFAFCERELAETAEHLSVQLGKFDAIKAFDCGYVAPSYGSDDMENVPVAVDSPKSPTQSCSRRLCRDSRAERSEK